MIEHLTPSRLRANLYRVLDRVLATGRPVTIERRGRRLQIVPEASRKLDALKAHPDYLKDDPEALVHMDWSGEWRP
ncbi:type II toxin-antitoxin system Phd/YefM family antitoxin [Spiribacter halobius]|uniref:Antitoxin n=1 Tax=Sediminicurvatus halobius TaxID=2182432 RepID=A0A2U2N1M0_9GAMM|nr:type II toxin-antitoxin system Phd/YefM family antitoxin [Spiribacter halobius]PWG62957.1 type II toxin-antitoxin system Phd/YefM family antitoxin [Spiribacter halobius]UEX77471.1 type II toxin-antitoxin system Phd/YefM family antitoxin [Spiribacter halobius]